MRFVERILLGVVAGTCVVFGIIKREDVAILISCLLGGFTLFLVGNFWRYGEKVKTYRHMDIDEHDEAVALDFQLLFTSFAFFVLATIALSFVF